jgi:mono/diheme cytochrome c family protein
MMAAQQKTRRSVLIITGISMALLVTLISFYFLTRYTLVASALESLRNINQESDVAHGEMLFQTRGCAACHTLAKAGSNDETGPNLTGLGQRMTEAEIRTSIVTPNESIAEMCPEGACEANVMPDYGRILSDEQVAALVSYLQEE